MCSTPTLDPQRVAYPVGHFICLEIIGKLQHGNSRVSTEHVDIFSCLRSNNMVLSKRVGGPDLSIPVVLQVERDS